MIPPNTPIAVTLTAERWNQVIALMVEAPAPHRVSHPLIHEIHAQCMAAEKPAEADNVTAFVSPSTGC